MLTYITVLLFSLAAALSDLKDGRISNRLILFGLLSFLFCRAAECLIVLTEGRAVSFLSPGENPKAAELLLSAGCCILLLAFWQLRLLGGGDVKLFWLLFLYLPGTPGIFCFLFSFLFAFPAAVYGLFTGVRKVRLGGAVFLAVLLSAGMEVKSL